MATPAHPALGGLAHTSLVGDALGDAVVGPVVGLIVGEYVVSLQ
jgi:hypothetical protein